MVYVKIFCQAKIFVGSYHYILSLGTRYIA